VGDETPSVRIVICEFIGVTSGAGQSAGRRPSSSATHTFSNGAARPRDLIASRHPAGISIVVQKSRGTEWSECPASISSSPVARNDGYDALTWIAAQALVPKRPSRHRRLLV